MLNAEEILAEFYHPDSRLYEILIRHGRDVADMAVNIAHYFPEPIDIDFIAEASMLHDIGIFLTNTPQLGCTGVHPYVCHGYLGHDLLEKKGHPKHALVCERHVGTGITLEDIRTCNLPLPYRDMSPVSIEEQIICYADKFFSKAKNDSAGKKTIAEIIKELEKYGSDKVDRFQKWVSLFNPCDAMESEEIRINNRM